MSSKATRGDWKRGERLSGSVMEQETSWSQQLDGNFAERTCFLDVSGLHGHQTLPSPYGMLILMYSCAAAVCSTVISHVALVCVW